MHRINFIPKDDFCQHFLFSHESHYQICPSCGNIIWSNVEKGAESAPLLKAQKMMRLLLNPKIEYVIIAVIAIAYTVNFFLLEPITTIQSELSIPAFGYRGLRHARLQFSEVWCYVMVFQLFFLVLEQERRQQFREKFALSILEERRYDWITSWRRWMLRFGFMTIVVLLSNIWIMFQARLFPVPYANFLISQGHREEAYQVIDIYAKSSLWYFNAYALIITLYNALTCARQRLLVWLNERYVLT